MKTAEANIKNNPWYPKLATVHKVVLHRDLVIQNAIILINFLSEEKQERKRNQNVSQRSYP